MNADGVKLAVINGIKGYLASNPITDHGLNIDTIYAPDEYKDVVSNTLAIKPVDLEAKHYLNCKEETVLFYIACNMAYEDLASWMGSRMVQIMESIKIQGVSIFEVTLYDNSPMNPTNNSSNLGAIQQKFIKFKGQSNG